MNAGYVAGCLLLSAAILFATGWRRQLTEETPRVGIIVYFAGMIVLLNTPNTMSLHLYWSAMSLVLVGAGIKPRIKQLYAVAGVAFIGVLWVWFRRLYAVDPAFVLWHPYWDGPIAVGLVAALLASRFSEQYAIITGALLLAEWTADAPSQGWEWADTWLAALAAARLTSGFIGGMAYLLAGIRRRRMMRL